MQVVDEPSVQKALERGVLHFANTSLPGTKGNMVLVGHSSNSVWEPGDYKFVFALLDRLDAGDKIYVTFEGQRFTFIVNGEKVVSPSDVSVLSQTQKPTITLITCTPVGTAISRLVITAEQTSPDPATAKDNQSSQMNSNLQLPGN
jgi:sortase A